MADDEKKEAGDKNDPRRLHSFPLIRVSYMCQFSTCFSVSDSARLRFRVHSDSTLITTVLYRLHLFYVKINRSVYD